MNIQTLGGNFEFRILVGFMILVLCSYLLLQSVESFMVLPQTRRNMSYDLRGDPYIPYTPVSPWYQPSVGPIRNRPLILE